MQSTEIMKPTEFKIIKAELLREEGYKGVSDFKNHPVYLHFENDFRTEVKYLTRNEAEQLFESLRTVLTALDHAENFRRCYELRKKRVPDHL